MLFEYVDVTRLVIYSVVMYRGVYDCISLPIVDKVVFNSAKRFILDAVVVHMIVKIGYGFCVCCGL